MVLVYVVADAGELFIYTTLLTRWLVLFLRGGSLAGPLYSSSLAVSSLAQIHFWLELHHQWLAEAAFYQALWHVNS